MTFWTKIAGFILRNRYYVLALVTTITLLLATQIKNISLSYTEPNLLPEDHQVNLEYNNFLKIFGEEGNLIILGVKDKTIFTPKKFNAWNKLVKSFDSLPEVAFTVSTGDIKKLKKDTAKRQFVLEKLYEEEPSTIAEVQAIKKKLFEELPFYENLLYNKQGTLQTAIYLKKDIVNTIVRKKFVLNVLIGKIKEFEEKYELDVRVSGMPYIRTVNSQNIVNEMGLFVGGALLITALIFFFFFRSFRATFITLFVVTIGVVWSFGVVGLLGFDITVLSAIIPPLIIVIGVPNAVFLINKYQQEVKKHGNKARSLQRVITKVGNATLMTNLTTASGFATFIFVKSSLMREFGILASINIISVFILSLLIIPVLYSFMPLPKEKHLSHLEKKWMSNIVAWMERTVRKERIYIYCGTVAVIILSMIGMNLIKVSGSLIEDMPKSKEFYKDIKFFEQEFGGIMPLEILIDTKRKKGVMKLKTLEKIDKINEVIESFNTELSKPVSVNNIVKYSKQAFYNGNPKYYQLPTSQEKAHIFKYTKNSNANKGMLKNFVDETGRYARITTFMKDIGTERMDIIQDRLQVAIDKYFPKEQFEVTITGRALVFLKGTKFLIKNLAISLSIAILLISILMAWMFRSLPMILISLIPNMLPLLITAGLMGYFGIPIKPSTILVFSIAFGISVDDTIHFLAKYRQELLANNWKVRPAVYSALRETGVSMFYTSIVLFFGFLVFTTSSFGGTIALGGLVSVTLLLAMVANLLLLPSLLLSFEKRIANKNFIKESDFDILSDKETSK